LTAGEVLSLPKGVNRGKLLSIMPRNPKKSATSEGTPKALESALGTPAAPGRGTPDSAAWGGDPNRDKVRLGTPAAMSKTFEQGKDEVAGLCDYFAKNRAPFSAPGMKEARVRQDLIDPLFRALGWDVGNAGRVAPQYCEVVVEDSLDVEGQQKAPDYTFRVGTLPKFYVEAKKCGVNIFADLAPAYQLRRYGWSAKVAVSILTDFEEMGVYDCTLRPRPSDKASHARILYYRFDEYPDRWRELWDIFSREAVWTGAFDQYAASKRKRGTSEVDVEFLKELEGWRDELARNIALRNHNLSGDELNRAVQLTIDRVVFLRMGEDRGLEPYEQLLTLCRQSDIYESYMKLCRKADDRYNSGLFHFQKETGVSEAPDSITPRLAVDDKVFKPILQSLYFAHGSPYEFKVLPVEILGTVYERFLGKVIRLTAGHQAKIEEKPEVRKAGGVYYTPAYIVNYIVRQTVARQIEGKSPAQLAGRRSMGVPPMSSTGILPVEQQGQSPFSETTPKKGTVPRQPFRVLDMACGSGSFLLGAYQCLLDHCLKWYIDNGPEKYPNAVYDLATAKRSEAGWRLTIAEKKRILTTHVFGVDIDPQAVEVSKLSLLLKVLEGESAETVGNTMRLFHERALPNLADNIKCGNSLIGPDYFTGRLSFDEQPDTEEFARVNAFDWNREFPAVFRGTGVSPARPTGILPVEEEARGRDAHATRGQDALATHGQDAHATSGGFDCVIGNPPYIRIQTMKETAPLEVEIYKELFQTAREGNYDIYVVFLEKGLQLLNERGRLGFICPHKFFNAKYGAPVRGIVANGQHLAHVVHFGDQQVFDGATTYTCLLFLDKSPAKDCHFVKVNDLTSWRASGAGTEGTIKANQVTGKEWNFAVGRGAALFEKLARMPVKLANVADRIFQGLVTGADPVFILTDAGGGRYFSHATQSEYRIEAELMHPLCKGSLNIRRYMVTEPDKSILFPYRLIQGKAVLLTTKELAAEYPSAWKYLQINRAALEERERGKWKRADWYAFGRSQNLSEMDQSKLLTPSIAKRPSFTYDEKNFYYFVGSGGGGGGGYGIILNKSRGMSYEYLLGLLNSRLLDWVIKQSGGLFRGGYYAFSRQYIEALPVRTIDPANSAEKTAHDRMVKLVDSMLALHKQLASAKSEGQRGAIQRQIEATDAEIDSLVYDLYGLTAEEIAIVEGKK